jgi:hypothetical protein
MNNPIQPTHGRIVWYRGKDGASRAAIVVGVNGVFNLNLFVFGYNSFDSEQGYKDSVTHADPNVEPNCLPSWDWMPYQKQQAEKHASEAARADEPNAMPTMPTTGLTFGSALEAIKTGKRMARSGWNGKNMFVFLVPGSQFNVNRPPLLGIYPDGTPITYRPHIDIKGADGSISTWVPSIGDVMAEDWQIVE